MCAGFVGFVRFLVVLNVRVRVLSVFVMVLGFKINKQRFRRVS